MAAIVKGSLSGPPPVDSNNFDVWTKVFKGYLMTQKPDDLETAFDVVNDEEFDDGELKKLKKIRRKAYGYLLLACQSDLTAQNVEAGDCLGLYCLLEARFSLKLPATLNTERGIFFKMKCLPSESTDKFVDRVKDQVTKISNFGYQYMPADDEIVTVLMEGIKESYSTLWTTIFSNPKSLDKLY